MKLDAHQHFWKYSPVEYAWIDETMSAIRRDFLPADLERELQTAGFDGSIAVQARQTVAETEWLLDLAAQSKIVKGIVGWVDLRSERVGEELERYAANPLFRGVRHVAQDEPDDNFILRPDFLRGISKLERFGLTYDILIFARHLEPATRLAERFPDQPFVIDHIAKPEIKARRFDEWARGIKQIAAHENVFCKLSGMVTEADWRGWTAQTFRPYIETAIDVFGPARLMIGSDWPVALLAGTYGEVMQIVASHIETLTPSERAAILGETARTFYGVVP